MWFWFIVMLVGALLFVGVGVIAAVIVNNTIAITTIDYDVGVIGGTIAVAYTAAASNVVEFCVGNEGIDLAVDNGNGVTIDEILTVIVAVTDATDDSIAVTIVDDIGVAVVVTGSGFITVDFTEVSVAVTVVNGNGVVAYDIVTDDVIDNLASAIAVTVTKDNIVYVVVSVIASIAIRIFHTVIDSVANSIIVVTVNGCAADTTITAVIVVVDGAVYIKTAVVIVAPGAVSIAIAACMARTAGAAAVGVSCWMVNRAEVDEFSPKKL